MVINKICKKKEKNKLKQKKFFESNCRSKMYFFGIFNDY